MLEEDIEHLALLVLTTNLCAGNPVTDAFTSHLGAMWHNGQTSSSLPGAKGLGPDLDHVNFPVFVLSVQAWAWMFFPPEVHFACIPGGHSRTSCEYMPSLFQLLQPLWLGCDLIAHPFHSVSGGDKAWRARLIRLFNSFHWAGHEGLEAYPPVLL